MLGFVGMIATEVITGVNTLQAWGLQDVYFGISSWAVKKICAALVVLLGEEFDVVHGGSQSSIEVLPQHHQGHHQPQVP